MDSKVKRKPVEVNLMEMLKYVVYKWRVILLWSIIIAVLFSSYGVMKNVSFNKQIRNNNKTIETDIANTDNLTEDQEEKLDKYIQTLKLDSLEINNVKTALGMYSVLEEHYNRIEYSNINKKTLQYVLQVNNTESSSSEVIKTILSGIKQYILNGGLSTSIINAGYEKKTDIELISVDETEKSIVNKDTDINFRMSQGEITSIEPFYIMYRADENDEITQYVKNAVENYINNFDIMGDIQLILIDEYISNEHNMEGVSETKDLTRTISDLYSQFISFTNGFSEEQKILFNNIQNENIFDVDISGEANANFVTDDGTSLYVSVFSGIYKYMILGVLLGLFLITAWYVIKFILDDTIKTTKDFEIAYDLYDIGYVRADKLYSGLGAIIDRLLDRIFGVNIESYRKREQMVCINIKALCETKGINKVSISSSMNLSDEEKKIVNEVVKDLEQNGIEAKFTGNPLQNVEAFEKLLGNENAILLEKPLVSKFNSVDSLLDICKMHKVEVLGVICC